MNEQEFRSYLAAHGYGDVRVLEYEPDHAPDLHQHDFSAMGMVRAGALTIVYEGDRQVFEVGEWYEVPAGTIHAEQTGSVGATALLGVKRYH